MKIKALNDKVLVHNMEKGERRTPGGIVMVDDDGKDFGIRARWAQVYSVGKDVTPDVMPGQWVYIEHGKWTRVMEVSEGGATTKLWGTTEEHILLVSDEKPVEFKQRY